MTRILTLAALLVSLAFSALASESYDGPMRQVYFERTDRGGEQQTRLDVSEGRQVMFNLPLPAHHMEVGNLICARAYLRATNNSGSTVAFGGYLFLADHRSSQVSPKSEADKLSQLHGENATLAIHHDQLNHAGCRIINGTTDGRSYLVFVARAQSSDGGAHLRIDRGLGHMEYRIYEPVE